MPRFPQLPHTFRQTAARKSNSILLENALGGGSHLFVDPIEVLEIREPADVDSLFGRIEAALNRGYYVAGFMSYEAGYGFEKALRASFRNTSQSVLAWFGVYEHPIIFDPSAQGSSTDAHNEDFGAVASSLLIDIDEDAYTTKVRTLRHWIEQGDTYQANLTTFVRWQNQFAPEEVLRRILRTQPVEFGALIHFGETHIISASPELFFHRDGYEIVTRPMKGTASRGRTLREDDSRRTWLAQDEKNRAENLMIVDLLRSDLGRICRFGSVSTTGLFKVSQFPTVFQMTSDVTGMLREDISYAEIFRSLFPSGSIVGAPKIRTMQILRDLEQTDRGVYTGCIGYFAPGNKAVFSVAIRTIVLNGNEAKMGVGSGIVYDSVAANEYIECRTKTRFLTEFSTSFRLIETLLWSGNFSFLNEHLSRLCDSARYFNFAFDEVAVKKCLEDAVLGFADGSPRRVRLLLSEDGGADVDSALMDFDQSQSVDVVISKHRTVASDRFLFHKTTQRHIYDAAHKRAQELGCADAIFFNGDEQLTEGAIHNIIVVKEGIKKTPTLHCGVLPGVYRDHLLRTTELLESVLTLEDLLTADEVFLCNSVRGIRRVERIVCDGGEQAHLWRYGKDIG
jgi:para-aminobenzoate synthetase/4-amino-4-deoxychorismate lyase